MYLGHDFRIANYKTKFNNYEQVTIFHKALALHVKPK